METIIGSLITGGLALIGVIITCLMTSRKTDQKMQVNQAVTETKIEELTREVREHNNFARRMPVVEEKLKELDRRITRLHKEE